MANSAREKATTPRNGSKWAFTSGKTMPKRLNALRSKWAWTEYGTGWFHVTASGALTQRLASRAYSQAGGVCMGAPHPGEGRENGNLMVAAQKRNPQKHAGECGIGSGPRAAGGSQLEEEHQGNPDGAVHHHGPGRVAQKARQAE